MDGAIFRDRREAGRVLAGRLAEYRGGDDVVVLGLPRGGVPVAYEVARALEVPLDIFVVRKLGVPGHRELAMGAIATGGVRVLNDDVVAALGIPASAIDESAGEEAIELERREREYRGSRPRIEVKGRIAILVDDGLATGSTMAAAVKAVRRRDPARIVVAVPVGAPQSCREMGRIADEVACAREPTQFAAVGQWYADFEQTTDEEVRALLRDAADRRQSA